MNTRKALAATRRHMLQSQEKETLITTRKRLLAVIDYTNYTDPHTPVTPDIEDRVMRAILATGRSDKWFNYDAACNWLARHPEANPATAIALYDYQTPRVVVTQSWVTNDISDIDVETVCWREWEGRIWRVTFFENAGGSEPLIVEVDAPGSDEPPYMTEAEHYANDCRYDDGDEEPALAQLGL